MKIALVTGASSGLGREFVRQIAEQGKVEEIWVIARRRDRLEALQSISAVPIRVLALDLTRPGDMEYLRNTLQDELPDIRILVNAAGMGRMGPTVDIPAKDNDAMIDLNCRGLTEMTCTCLPWMHKGTRIINLASAAAFCPQARFAVYAATKSYVLSFSRSLAAELKEKGIFVTAVCPGPVDTPFFEVSGKLPGGMKEAVMADPVQVVKQALIDAKYKKEVSVYGTAMKGAEAATKVLPHGMILKAMSMMEKITKE